MFFFFCLDFFSQTFTNHKTPEEEGGHFFNSSLPLPPASQTFRHQPGDYRRELTPTHSQQPDSNRESLLSERKSLTTKLRVEIAISHHFMPESFVLIYHIHMIQQFHFCLYSLKVRLFRYLQVRYKKERNKNS